MAARIEGVSSLVLLASVHRCVSLDPAAICSQLHPPCPPQDIQFVSQWLQFLLNFSVPPLFFSRGASSLGALQLFPLERYFELSRSFARVPSDLKGLLACFASIYSREVTYSGSNGVSAVKPKTPPFPSCLPPRAHSSAPRVSRFLHLALLPPKRPFLFCLPRSGK